MRKLLRPIDKRPLEYLITSFVRFARLESSASIVLLLAATAAVVLANSRIAPAYEVLLNIPIHFSVGTVAISWTIHDCVNDLLMALFFLVIGLEVKRELVIGELASLRRALLPMLAALGGVLTPIAIYLTLNHENSAEMGWGVPIATDVAFSLAVLALFGRRIPIGLKVFLVTLAIVDDIAGVLVIAIAYTDRLHFGYLALVALIVLFCLALNWFGVKRLSIYMTAGIALWCAVRVSGLHPTVAGILLAMTIPAQVSIQSKAFLGRGGVQLPAVAQPPKQLHSIRTSTELYESPLDRLQAMLHPWVSFGIVPLFAITNADISVRAIHFDPVFRPVFWGILLGLLVGKPLGITLFSWTAVRLRLAELPRGITWAQLHAVSWLGGIGFTVSIFIAGLAFEEQQRYAIARIAVCIASLIAAGIGASLLALNLASEKVDVTEVSPAGQMRWSSEK
ncbi:MAG: Na+/H+ antiporter NhaA [Candidatus Sulfotelmatobacter sp.]